MMTRQTRRVVTWWKLTRIRLTGLLLLACLLGGCAPVAAGASVATAAQGECAPTDQDQFVYDPGRLQVVQSCIRVTGTVDDTWISTDGDSIILLRLDPPFEHLLTPGNSEGEERGDLALEAVCTVPSVEAAVIGLCAGDPDPVVGPYPAIGTRIWAEGRYIYDLHHEAHAELHPLYRFGTIVA